ncbi:S1 family peptidase [Methylomonas sp. MED-D]|uniref:S1 family peptidase n=1 Tax=unclassified Methylomonas TaxID=2608980 RepID=UPI0028A46FB3|nr:serine protease [Methylomonas sp. MV1]MDT4331336.1 serine protease [Methylomonas sp. MV1]
MAKRLIVTILAPTVGPSGERRDQWSGAIGTGIAVGDGLILTARHVVRQAGRDAQFPIKVRWYEFCDRTDPYSGWVDLQRDDTAAVAWDGGDSLDAVLLRCPSHPDAQKIRKPAISASLPQEGAKWLSRGFPKITNIAKLREHGDFFGAVCGPTPADSVFKLKNEFQTDSEEGWSGASGMPVLVNSEIVGIIQDVPRYFKTEQFQAVPAYRLRLDSAFCECLGLDREPDRLKTAHDLIVRLLQACGSATEKLAEGFGFTTGTIDQRREQVAGKALNTELDELFDVTVDAQHVLLADSDFAGAEAVARFVQVILPVLHKSADADAVRSNHAAKSGVLHEIGACHKTLAELVMARADGRPAAYHKPSHPNEFPSALPCLPTPPEAGRDVDGRQFQRDFTEHLAQKAEVWIDGRFKNQFVDYLRGRFTDPGLPLTTDEALIAWINDGLTRDAKRQARANGVRRYTYYYLVETPADSDPAQLADQNQVLGELAERFPEIAFIRLAPPDPMWRELLDYSLLRDLLYANTGPRP